MNCNLAVCSEGASVDSSSNLLSIFNVIDEITAQAFPTVIPKVTIVFLVEKTEGDPELVPAHLVIRHNERDFVRQPVSIDFQNKLRMRLVVSFVGVVLSAPGDLVAALMINDQELGRWRIAVIQSALPPPQIVIEPVAPPTPQD